MTGLCRSFLASVYLPNLRCGFSRQRAGKKAKKPSLSKNHTTEKFYLLVPSLNQ
jgi:hypothetical protein